MFMSYLTTKLLKAFISTLKQSHAGKMMDDDLRLRMMGFKNDLVVIAHSKYKHAVAVDSVLCYPA